MTCSVLGCWNPVKGKKLCCSHLHRLHRYGDPTGKPEPRVRPVCTIAGCNRDNMAGGFCSMHYKRNARYGNPSGGGLWRGPDGDIEKFLTELIGTTTDECVVWPFYCTADGYGRINRNHISQTAHSYVAEQVYGKKKGGQEALHSCGNGQHGCVNPNHISWGTRQANVHDAIRHGTAKFWGRPVPENHPIRLLAKRKAA